MKHKRFQQVQENKQIIIKEEGRKKEGTVKKLIQIYI